MLNVKRGIAFCVCVLGEVNVNFFHLFKKNTIYTVLVFSN